MRDFEGNTPVKDTIDIALARGEGQINFSVPSPLTNRPEPRVSHFIKADGYVMAVDIMK
jgi:hypothetical protein